MAAADPTLRERRILGWPRVWWGMQLASFLPTYRATRIITEVLAESAPQMVLQAYILARVFGGGDGAAPAAYVSLRAQLSILPMSLTISAANVLKVWIELLMGARAAGVSLRAWLAVVFQMGAGSMPIDAIRHSLLEELVWDRPVEIDWRIIADAFLQNTSLITVRLRDEGLMNADAQHDLTALAAAFARGATPQLMTLQLSDCHIGDAGLKSLADAGARGGLPNSSPWSFGET